MVLKASVSPKKRGKVFSSATFNFIFPERRPDKIFRCCQAVISTSFSVWRVSVVSFFSTDWEKLEKQFNATNRNIVIFWYTVFS